MTCEQHKTNRGRNLKYRNAAAGVRPVSKDELQQAIADLDQDAAAAVEPTAS